MANMIPISTVTVGSGGASSVEFTSIPQIYTDLVIKLSLRLDSNPQSASWCSINIGLNGSSSNFTYRLLYGSGSGVAAQTGTTEIAWVDSSVATTSTFGNAELYMPNYTSSNYKSMSVDFVQEQNSTAALSGILASLWSSTSPVSSIKFTPPSGGFAQYSSATLYGIRKY